MLTFISMISMIDHTNKAVGAVTLPTIERMVPMEVPQGKHAWMVKIGEKGQFVIPKEARELFGIKPGQTILVLADEKKGIAIPTKADCERIFRQIIDELEKEE